MSILKFIIVFPCMWFGIGDLHNATGQLLVAFGFAVATCLPNSGKE